MGRGSCSSRDGLQQTASPPAPPSAPAPCLDPFLLTPTLRASPGPAPAPRLPGLRPAPRGLSDGEELGCVCTVEPPPAPHLHGGRHWGKGCPPPAPRPCAPEHRDTFGKCLLNERVIDTAKSFPYLRLSSRAPDNASWPLATPSPDPLRRQPCPPVLPAPRTPAPQEPGPGGPSSLRGGISVGSPGAATRCPQDRSRSVIRRPPSTPAGWSVCTGDQTAPLGPGAWRGEVSPGWAQSGQDGGCSKLRRVRVTPCFPASLLLSPCSLPATFHRQGPTGGPWGPRHSPMAETRSLRPRLWSRQTSPSWDSGRVQGGRSEVGVETRPPGSAKSSVTMGGEVGEEPVSASEAERLSLSAQHPPGPPGSGHRELGEGHEDSG